MPPGKRTTGDSRKGKGGAGANVEPGSIAARRRGARVSSIQRKQEEGRAHGKERGLVRMGVTNTNVLTGKEDISTWDDEELRRGQKRDKNGGWRGIAPVIVPKAIHDELVRRTISKANQLMTENLEEAVKVLTELVVGQDIEAKDKLRAIGMIMDRVMGKAPEKLEVSGETPPWQIAINAGIVSITSDKLGATPEGDEPEDYDE